MDDADLFLDDDLGDIPVDTLLELEQHAISSTQKPKPVNSQPPTAVGHRTRQAHNASSLTRSRASNPPWRPPQQRLPQQASRPFRNSNLDPPSQPFAYNDESVVNLDDQPHVLDWSQSQNLAQRPAIPPVSQWGDLSPADNDDHETAAAYAAAADAPLSEHTGDAAPRVKAGQVESVDISSLRARIAELEADNAKARATEAQVQKKLEAKAGEITIVRANLDKERREHDRRIIALQQDQAVQAAKHRAELEAGRKEREKMQTDNKFLQHDLAQEAEKARRLNGPGRPRAAQPEKETPKKTRRHGQHGDGFSDYEVLNISPSKSKERQKDSTPKAGTKRRRAAPDSPLPALSFVKPPAKFRQESSESLCTHNGSPAPVVTKTLESERLRFMQCLLTYCPFGGKAKALELLVRYAMPSAADRPLSSLLMDELALGHSSPGESMPIQLCRVLLRMWTVCLAVQYYEPHTIIVDLILFAISFEQPSHFSCLIEDLVPLCLKSLEMVTLPIVRASLGKAYAAAIDKARQERLAAQVDADQVTDLLHKLCQASTLSPERIEAYWRLVDFTSSMLLIHKALPMDRVILGMDVLATSALEESFGAIHSDPTLQEKQESDSIYRLTFAFFDTPTPPAGEPVYDVIEIADFRIGLLSVFQRMCQSDHNSEMLASHPHFVGKLIRFIEEQISKLYTLPASHTQFDIGLTTENELDEHDFVATTINMAVRILHHLLLRCDGTLNLGDRFNVVVGGYHKFLIGMTRIAFAEQGSVFEYGIDEEVIDAAHSILDHYLTPDDGEAIARALETPQGTRGMSGKKPVTQKPRQDAMIID